MGASPSPSPDERVPIGSVLDGRYRIDAVLGSGGMGRVYRGEHTGIGRTVAIKVLHADLNKNRDAASRFQREALASGRLDHPNIVGVSDFGVLEDGSCYLVMEALEGESLGARLARDKQLPWREALEILRGVLAGLRHAHDRGVVHRDIKPDNIFLARKEGQLVVKILDFGIAKLYQGSASDPASTRVGLTVGTPAYLSPEQAVGGEITPASDIYSTSIVLYEMITGRAPFEDKDPLAMLGAHVSRPAPPLAEVAPATAAELPPGLEDMLQRGLAKTIAERIPSAQDYLVWIDAVIAAAGPTATPLGIGVLPTATLTPVPGALATPAPGALRMPVVGETPAPDALGLTAALDSIAPGEIAKVMPAATRAVSLADAEPVPRRWLWIGGLVLAALVVLAVIVVLASGGSSASPDPAKAPPKADKASKSDEGAKATAPAPRPVPVTVPKPTPAPPPAAESDEQTELKAALYELEKGKDCKARRAAISKLVELDDPAAIPALKKARYRMTGGVLGIGQSNSNACLTKDAEAAIKKLSAE